MKDAIVDFFSNEEVDPDDTLLFYYTGHGIKSDLDGTVYFSPSEIDPKLPVKRGFSFTEFGTIIQNSVSRRKVAILDCCFSGSAKIGKGPRNDTQLIALINEESKELEQGEGTCILAASQPYQGAYHLEKKGHSVFTYHLLEGLRGNEESVDNYGSVTPYSLNRYIKKEIDKMPPEERPPQKPLMKSETSGEIILASYQSLSRKPVSVRSTETDAKKPFISQKPPSVDTNNSSSEFNNSIPHEKSLTSTSSSPRVKGKLKSYRFLELDKYRLLTLIVIAALVVIVAFAVATRQSIPSSSSSSTIIKQPKNISAPTIKPPITISSSNQSNGLSIYDNKTYGIGIQYPSNWTIQTSNAAGMPNNIATFMTPAGPSSNHTGTISIYLDRDYNTIKNLKDYAHFRLNTYENSTNFASFRLLELSMDSFLAGNPAYKLIGTYERNSDLQKLIEVGTIIGNKAYIIQFIADATQFPNYLSTVQKMINSLRVNASLSDIFQEGADAGLQKAGHDDPDFIDASVSDCEDEVGTNDVYFSNHVQDPHVWCLGFIQGYHDAENSILNAH